MSGDMEPLELSYTDALRYLEKAVAEKGEDYQYADFRGGLTTSCVYFRGDQPSCIVGHVLYYNGMTRNELNRDIRDFNRSSVQTLSNQGFIAVDNDTRHLLQRAQNLQDNGVPWGQAVEGAHRKASASHEQDN